MENLFSKSCYFKNIGDLVALTLPGGGGYLTRFWTGTCHRDFKHIPVPYTNFSKMYTRLYTNLSKICTGLYTNFPKMHTRPYTSCENCENRYRSLYQTRENRYRSLYQNRENRYPSRWHVPVPKICIVPPPRVTLTKHVFFIRNWFIRN